MATVANAHALGGRRLPIEWLAVARLAIASTSDLISALQDAGEDAAEWLRTPVTLPQLEAVLLECSLTFGAVDTNNHGVKAAAAAAAAPHHDATRPPR